MVLYACVARGPPLRSHAGHTQLFLLGAIVSPPRERLILFGGCRLGFFSFKAVAFPCLSAGRRCKTSKIFSSSSGGNFFFFFLPFLFLSRKPWHRCEAAGVSSLYGRTTQREGTVTTARAWRARRCFRNPARTQLRAEIYRNTVNRFPRTTSSGTG